MAPAAILFFERFVVPGSNMRESRFGTLKITLDKKNYLRYYYVIMKAKHKKSPLPTGDVSSVNASPEAMAEAGVLARIKNFIYTELANEKSWVSRSIMGLIAGSIALLTTEAFGVNIPYIEGIISVIFAAEYGARAWTAPLKYQGEGISDWEARRRYMLSPSGIIDLVATAPYFAGIAIPKINEYAGLAKMLRLIRLARVFKTLGKNETMKDVIGSVKAGGMPLIASGALMLCVAATYALIISVLEQGANGAQIKNPLDGFYWAISTFTTSGVSGLVPTTHGGQIAGSIAAMTGLPLVGLTLLALFNGFQKYDNEKKGSSQQGQDEAQLADIKETVNMLSAQIAEMQKAMNEFIAAQKTGDKER